MAYMDFTRDPLLAPSLDAPRHDPVEPEQTGLSALEWQVVALAQRDRMSSLNKPGRLAIALGTVFGPLQHNPRLADPKLEALRRMAVLSWHRGFSVPVSEIKAFHGAGFSPAQYETLVSSILAARPRVRA
ncbi:hypothetical protein GCM10011380_33530 [Sphingomonas metalli]|uniref:Uncharacterized protein n=1 Tax=Sphingomonas metalli TaxID=1779358 RepID=A0A916TE06_9SPHN|nr:hypothetical protein [Sphingomonas metalli]GGB41367.1 hypothetical protein GCM10011380_33530 [Sphingomonas metalli]